MSNPRDELSSHLPVQRSVTSCSRVPRIKTKEAVLAVKLAVGCFSFFAPMISGVTM
jgi:hypothetical protein